MRAIVAIFSLVASAPAIALQAASNEQVFCSGRVVAVAQVQNGTSEDCRIRMAEFCQPENGVHLSVTVSEVLAVRTDWERRFGDNYDPSFTPRHAMELVGRTLDLHLGTSDVPWVTKSDSERGPNNGGLLDNPSAAPLTDADVRRLYGGKRFIFAIDSSHNPGEPHESLAWPLNSKAWIIKFFRQKAGTYCPALLGRGGLFNGKPTADTPYRQALIARLEVQFAHQFETELGLPSSEAALTKARELNSDLDDASWGRIAGEIDNMLVSIVIARGTGLDLELRTVFDTFSTPELRRLSRMFADPAFNKFFTAMISSDHGLDDVTTAFPEAMRNVLEKHGLKVPK